MTTATDKVRVAMHALEDEVKALEAENNRLSTIYAMIWTNARRHGATEAEAESFIDGTGDFVAWMRAKIEEPGFKGPTRLCRDCKHFCHPVTDQHGYVKAKSFCSKISSTPLKDSRAKCLGKFWDAVRK